MELPQFLTYIGKVGDGLSWLTQKIIIWIANLGINLTPLGAKIMNILVFLLAAYAVVKLASAIKTPLRWGIVILFIFLAISTGVSFIV